MSRIEHFAIFTDQLESTRQFYQDLLGLTVLLDNSAAPVPGYFLADSHGAVLEVILRPAGVSALETRYVCHVAFWVEDLSAARAKLEAHAVEFEVDTAIDTSDFKTVFFRDPDGNRCQLVWRRKALSS
jgi:glyoxylase I family protein